MGDDTYDLDVALKEAAERFREKVRRDAGELWKRLERRKTGMLSRPLRAWCLAVRAGDRRITPYRAIVTPEYAVEEWQEHTVVLDARLLRWLCRPVRIPFPGLPAREVGKMLGCKASVVMEAAKKGALDVKRIKGLDGVRGWVPVVYAERYLDPSAGNLHRMADPLWGTSCTFLSDRVPEDVEQVVKRVRYVRGRLTEWRWVCPGCERCVRLLFYPMPAIVKVRVRLPEEVREQYGRTGVAQPRVSHGRQEGHNPECLPHQMGERVRVPEEVKGRMEEEERRLGTFACRTCHGLVFFSRASADAWNLFVARVTDGMLYGSEVRRPPGFPSVEEARGCEPDEPDAPDAHAAVVVRKFRWKKKRKALPLTERRRRVRDMMVDGRTRLEMSVELGCSVDAIKEDIRRVRRFYGVKTREELAGKLGKKAGVYLRARARKVMEMLVAGKRYEEIARELGVTYGSVALLALTIYKAYGVRRGWRRRERFLKKMVKVRAGVGVPRAA